MAIELSVIQGDAFKVDADVLVAKYAQQTYGLDRALVSNIKSTKFAGDLPGVGDHRVVTDIDNLKSRAVLFLGVEALYNLEIGTPIEPLPTAVGGNDSGQTLRSWIRNILSFYIEVGERGSILARQLREIIGTPDDQADGFPASIPSLILIRSDATAPDTSNISIQGS